MGFNTQDLFVAIDPSELRALSGETKVAFDAITTTESLPRSVPVSAMTIKTIRDMFPPGGVTVGKLDALLG